MKYAPRILCYFLSCFLLKRILEPLYRLFSLQFSSLLFLLYSSLILLLLSVSIRSCLMFHIDFSFFFFFKKQLPASLNASQHHERKKGVQGARGGGAGALCLRCRLAGALNCKQCCAAAVGSRMPFAAGRTARAPVLQPLRANCPNLMVQTSGEA